MSVKEPESTLIACEECGLVSEIPPMRGGQSASCSRCGHTLVRRIEFPHATMMAYGISSLVMLLLSTVFPFMSFSVQGIKHEITLMYAVKVFHYFGNNTLAVLLLITIIVLPALYILTLMYLFHVAEKHRRKAKPIRHPGLIKQLCRLVFRIETWLLVDVFLVGVLVSLVKIASLADVGMGHSFWAFCAYTVLVIKCMRNADKEWLWEHLFPSYPVNGVKSGDTHLSGNHVACGLCEQINPVVGEVPGNCVRCGSMLQPYEPERSLQWAWAFLIAAFIFYIPANLYPMMYTSSLGSTEVSTIMDGVIMLWNMGSYPIAMVIFIASIFVPLTKMLILTWLFVSAKRGRVSEDGESVVRLKYYRVTEIIGRWSMIDVFVVAILTALVQLKGLMSITPGPAALYFALVVVLTICSALVFDPRVFWGSFDGSQGKVQPESNSRTSMESGLVGKAEHE
ncbi:paraquat-inducible protein A [Parasalinivibrio latis]|uniref:PqiA/YebS family transporter subunit n=1 Tax=Parasalinivibrio latis TaxID=2952610 RepID=UPI0030E44FE6